MRFCRLAPVAAVVALVGSGDIGIAATVSLTPVQDNTMYSESGSTSNGAGPLYAGVPGGISGAGLIRRALVKFNLSSIPTASTVTNVTLTVLVAKTNTGAATFELHKVSAAWGEGTSSGVGQGAPATANDATWTQRLFSSTTPVNWTTAGGDFSATISSSQSLSTAATSYTFPTSAQLVADTQGWVTNSATNFGWLIKVANEGASGSSKELASREDLTAANRPTLTVTFTPPAEVEDWSMY